MHLFVVGGRIISQRALVSTGMFLVGRQDLTATDGVRRRVGIPSFLEFFFFFSRGLTPSGDERTGNA